MLLSVKNLIKLCLLLLVVSFHLQSNAQLLTENGDLFIRTSNIIDNLPDSFDDDYQDANSTLLQTWENMLYLLLLNDYTAAADSANTIGYDLIAYTDTTTTPNNLYYLLETNGSNYWGTYVYNPNYCRPLAIQSPHPKKDLNTGKQGIYVFIKTQSLFYFLSGTNRCNSLSYSPCDGSTSVCGLGSEDYRISDLAHNASSIFQKTTEVLFNTITNSHFIQLHGFTKQSTDPYLILSNGTQDTPTIDYFPTLAENLVAEDSVLTYKIAHIDLTWTKLRGFTNTQGRMINSSIDACEDPATNSSGRFYHMEQERIRLRNDSNGWDKVANALNNTFLREVSLKVLLEGAYDVNTALMRTNLLEENLLPLVQPYNSSPWNYMGTESLGSYADFPNNTVDWVLVEARIGQPDLTILSSTVVETKAAFLLSDGSIVGLDGGSLKFDNLTQQEYYFTIRHRNHLDIIASTTATISEGILTYDFTTATTQAFGPNQQILLDGKAMMMGGDYSADGIIQATDFDLWIVNPALLNIYGKTDGNLDASIQTTDYDLWFINRSKVGVVEIQY